MSAPTVSILVNKSTNDTPCTSSSGDSNYILLATGDQIVWRDSQQTSGGLLSGSAYPVVIPSSGSIEAPKTFLMDSSAGTYVQIPLAGTSAGGQNGGNTRYVFAAYISGATAATPYLEAWNSSSHAASDGSFLGAGDSNSSFLRAMATTNGTPGSATWSGTPLAGSGSRIALDGDLLTAGKFLYWNMKLIVPSGAGASSSSSYVLSIRVTYT